jgi:hypothetical protein
MEENTLLSSAFLIGVFDLDLLEFINSALFLASFSSLAFCLAFSSSSFFFFNILLYN